MHSVVTRLCESRDVVVPHDGVDSMLAGESRHGLDGIAGRHGERSAERPQLVGERGDGGDELASAVRSGGVEQAMVEHVDREHFGVVEGGGRPCEIVVE